MNCVVEIFGLYIDNVVEFSSVNFFDIFYPSFTFFY